MKKHQKVACQVLDMFAQSRLDGVAIVNAIATITIGYFKLADFSPGTDRLARFDDWASQVRARLASVLAAPRPIDDEPAGRA